MASASDLASDKADLKGRVLELLCIRGHKICRRRCPGGLLSVFPERRLFQVLLPPGKRYGGQPAHSEIGSQGWLCSNDHAVNSRAPY